MPLIVSGLAAFAYSVERRLEQVDEGDVVRLGDLGHRRRCRARAARCSPLPSGRLRSCRFSWAMGEKRTSRGVELAVVLLGQRVLDEGVEVLLERRRARPCRRTTRCSRRRRRRRRPWCRSATGRGCRSRPSGAGAVSSSPEKPRLRMTSSCLGKRLWRIVSSQPSCCIRSASVLPMIADVIAGVDFQCRGGRGLGGPQGDCQGQDDGGAANGAQGDGGHCDRPRCRFTVKTAGGRGSIGSSFVLWVLWIL